MIKIEAIELLKRNTARVYEIGTTLGKYGLADWLNNIFGSMKYGSAMRKRIQEQIGQMRNLTITEKETAWERIAPLLNVEAG